MLHELFSIESFNIVSDNDYYYFFRALNNRDHNDIINNRIVDEDGIHTIYTDREHYIGDSKYNYDSNISLEEVYDHIKYNHRIDTNCISLTSNSSVALLYGRESYHDEYIIVKVPKNELGNNTILAGLYMLEEIDKKISNMELDELSKYYLDSIDNCSTQEQLDDIMMQFNTKIYDDSIFQRGIKYIKPVETITYSSLNEKQNFIKNKMVAKVNVINKQILPNVSNSLLIQTVGIAFSSLELIHYNQIRKKEIINCSSYVMDIISILQQINNPLSRELQMYIINNIDKINYNFEYNNYNAEDINLDELYSLTNGGLNYLESKNIINTLFYLSKSKLRCINIVNTLKTITNNNPKYEELFNEIISKCYGIEYQIINKNYTNQFKISESIGFDIANNNFINYINSLNEEEMYNVLTNKYEAFKNYIEKYNIEIKRVSKIRWLSYAIIDLYNWKKLNIEEISYKQRKELSDKLIEKNFYDKYYSLRQQGINDKDISNILLTSMVKKIDVSEINIKETFTISEIENFLGYYKINNTGIILRDYQASTVKNIDICHENHRFCSAILPTGGGKSFLALTEMLKYRDKKILYVAPNDVILGQIEDYIVEYIRGKQGTFGNFTSAKARAKIIKEVFPNLKLVTYQKINIAPNEREKEYDFVVLDEIHRSGAPEWIKSITELLDNQPVYTKFLGLTATPIRDCDGIDMVNYWAKHFGYTKSEILRHKHLAINMDIYEAIKLGYVVNPKVVSCAYDLIRENGDMSNLLEQIKTIKNPDKQKELYDKYKELTKKVEEADGVKQILNTYLKQGRKYIVFCPVKNSRGITVEDEDGNIIDARITGEDVIKKYTGLLEEYLGKDNIECYSMLASYSNSKNRRQRELFEMGSDDKINFLIVMDKANEGMHIKNNGLIWFRALDDESIILCSQQFGRIVYSIEPGQEIKDDDLPIAIDLTNNLIRIKLNKNTLGTKADDLDKLKLVYDWIQEYGILPDINSSNKVESRYASILKYIQKKYRKYFDKELYDKISDDEREYINEVIEIGNSIDLWNIIIPKKEKKLGNNKDNTELFALSPLLQDFYNLKMEVEKNIVCITFEDKVEELYQAIINNGSKIKSNSTDKFSDGTLMASFIQNDYSRNHIVEYAKENEHAKKIVDMYHMNMSTLEYRISVFMNRVIYLYENYVSVNKELPKTNSTDVFPDGTVIFLWLKRDEHKELFKLLIDKKYEYVKEVYNYIGWENKLTKEDILLLRIKEIYESYISVGKPLPMKSSKEAFIDGARIYGVLRHSKDDIYALSGEGNEYAKAIIDNGFYISKEEKSTKLFEDRISYIYEKYILCNKPLPQRNDSDTFEDEGITIGNWLKMNKNKIIKAAKSGDIRLQKISELLIYNKKRKNYDEFNDTLDYIYNELKTGKSIIDIKDIVLSNGRIISKWIYEKREKLEELAQQRNEKANYIVNVLVGIKNKSSVETRLNYLYENYVSKNNPIPTDVKYKFEDGTSIAAWLYRKNIRLKIRSMALDGNEIASILAEKLNINMGELEISDEDIKNINYLVETYLDKGLSLPTVTNDSVFPNTGRLISDWINTKREIIKYLASKENENAKKMVDYYCWDESKDKLEESTKIRLKHVYDNYVKLGRTIPSSVDQDTFEESSTLVGVWIRRPRIKKAILDLVSKGNEEAKYVYESAKFDVFMTKEEQFIERLKFIYENYVLKNKHIIITNMEDKFDDGVVLGPWLKKNRRKIVELSSSNEYASIICNEYKLNLSMEERYNEQYMEVFYAKLKYIYDTYIKTKKGLPKYDSSENFEDGTPIYKWINRTRNKEEIQKLALEGDSIAMSIMELTTWGKKAIKSISLTNGVALSIALKKGWVLEKEVIGTKVYQEMQKKKVKSD